jgi:hypothetical protein
MRLDCIVIIVYFVACAAIAGFEGNALKMAAVTASILAKGIADVPRGLENS